MVPRFYLKYFYTIEKSSPKNISFNYKILNFPNITLITIMKFNYNIQTANICTDWVIIVKEFWVSSKGTACIQTSNNSWNIDIHHFASFVNWTVSFCSISLHWSLPTPTCTRVDYSCIYVISNIRINVDKQQEMFKWRNLP